MPIFNNNSDKKLNLLYTSILFLCLMQISLIIIYFLTNNFYWYNTFKEYFQINVQQFWQ